MALKDSKKTFATNLKDSTKVANICAEHFRAKDYIVEVEKTATGSFLSLTKKGGTFKSISGMKTGLNITLTMLPGVMEVEMDVGIFGKQALPTAISALVFWPVLIPQIYGLVQQNELDKEAYRIIELGIRQVEGASPQKQSGKFCPECGMNIPDNSLFCPGCGKKVEEAKSICCPSCGEQLLPGSAFCSKCGAKAR